MKTSCSPFSPNPRVAKSTWSQSIELGFGEITIVIFIPIMLHHAHRGSSFNRSLRILRSKYANGKRFVTTTRVAAVHVLELINAFRNRGHFAAMLDPLGAERIASWLPSKVEEFPDVIQLLKNYPYPLDLRPFKLDMVSLGDKVDLGKSDQYGKFNDLTLRELVASLTDCYCGSVGVEYSHIENSKCLQS